MFFEIGVVHSPNSTKNNLGNGLKQINFFQIPEIAQSKTLKKVIAVLDANLCKSICNKLSDLRTSYYKPSQSKYAISLVINLPSVFLELGQVPGLRLNGLF